MCPASKWYIKVITWALMVCLIYTPSPSGLRPSGIGCIYQANHSCPCYNLYIYNWSAFLKSILPTFQSNRWYNGTHGGCQLGSGDLGLLPLTKWPTGVSLATVWASWLLMGCPKQEFLPPPTPLIPPRATAHPTHPLYWQY